MKSRPRGIALIINNKNFKTMLQRRGTDIDCRNLENIFTQLGFNVVVHNDLKGRVSTCAILKSIINRGLFSVEIYVDTIFFHKNLSKYCIIPLSVLSSDVECLVNVE